MLIDGPGLITRKDQNQELKNIYDEYRTCCLSAKYYGRKLRFIRFLSVLLDLVVAASATLAAVEVLKGKYQEFLQWLAAASALGALLKSALGIEKALARVMRLHAGYYGISEKYRRICNEIQVEQSLSDALRAKINDLIAQTDQLAADEDAVPSRRMLGKCQDEVEREIPSSSLYWPNCHPGATSADAQRPEV